MVSWAITGASRGLGLEFVRQLSQQKTNIVFALVRNTKTAAGLTKLAGERSNVHIVQGDLDSLTQLQEAAKAVSAITGGSLDVLINNGAYLDSAAAALLPTQVTTPENLDTFTDAIDKSVKSNVLGAIYVTNSFLPLIEQGKEKKIVHITTGYADTELVVKCSVANSVPYTASKAMLNAVVARYGAELQPKGVHVVAISPGFVDTNPMPKEVEDFLLSTFKKIEPDAERISPTTSVKMQLAVIEKLGWDVQGRAISHWGNQTRWI